MSKEKINMACLKLLLNGSLIIIVTTVFVTAKVNLPQYIIPKHYNIKLKTYIDDNKFYGECNASINIHQTTQKIKLYAEKLCITDIKLIKSLEGFDKDDVEIKIFEPTYLCDNKTHIVNLNFTEVLLGNYNLKMRFIGTLADNRGIKIFYKGRENTAWLPAMHFKTSYAQQIFPCWEDLTLETTFNISIMHYKDYIISSNMPGREEEADENGMMWTHFDTTPPIPPYLVAAVIANKSEFFKLKSGIDDVTIQCRPYTLFDLSYAESIMAGITLFLKRNWENVKVISKVDNIVIPNYEDNDIINSGLIFYRESDITYDEDKDPPGRKVEVACLIGYKAAQEWFHNVFNTSWCSAPWLHKAFVTFMGEYAIDKVFPKTRMMDLFVIQIQHEVLHLDVDFQSSISQAAFSKIIFYLKVPIILRMLQHVVTEQLFWNIMRTCIYDHAYTIVRPLSFWSLLKTAYYFEQEWDRQTLQKKMSVTRRIQQLRTWMNQKHYPVINVKREYDQSRFTIEDVTIAIVNITKRLSIPLTYTMQVQSNFYNTSPNIWLFYEKSDIGQSNKPYIQKIKDLTSDQWIIFNLQQTGYYRVNYDSQNWELITMYLKKNYANIHVLNRAQLIDDAFHLMLTHQIDSSIFWDITKYLQQETDYVAWYPMFKALEYMSSIFSIDIVGSKLHFVRIMMRNTLHDMLEKINYTEVPNEDEHKKCLRQEAAKWACLLQRRECLEEANNKLMQHFGDPKKHKLLPWWTEWTYRNGSSMCEANSIWQDLYNMWVNNTDNKISKFLSCTQNVDIMKDYLSKTANMIKKSSPEDYILRSQAINNFLTIITKHVRIDIFRRYILSNFEEIIPRYISTLVTLTVIINHLYDDKKLTELEYSVKNNLRRERLFEFSTEILSQKDKEHEANANLLKIQDKIQNRRSQIEDLHKFSQIFKY